ncbi:uncharacterized protein [Panulirus ornatus]|uniref:uncharacterized protein n=1 Tax=Panulirus ornatus TaxID=150431 RepID=UPI003A8C7F72
MQKMVLLLCDALLLSSGTTAAPHGTPQQRVAPPSIFPSVENDFDVLGRKSRRDLAPTLSGPVGNDDRRSRGPRDDACPSAKPDPISSIFNFLSGTVLLTNLALDMIISTNNNNNNNNNNDNNNNNNNNNDNAISVEISNTNMNQANLRDLDHTTRRRTTRSSSSSIFSPSLDSVQCICPRTAALRTRPAMVHFDSPQISSRGPDLDAAQAYPHLTKAWNPYRQVSETAKSNINSKGNDSNASSRTRYSKGNSSNASSRTRYSKTSTIELKKVSLSSFFVNERTMACLSWAICSELATKWKTSAVEWVGQNLALSILKTKVSRFLPREERVLLRQAIARSRRRYWGDCDVFRPQCTL